ncbi:hypothetical protein V8E54_008301 [Elaphomyces granulatus]
MESDQSYTAIVSDSRTTTCRLRARLAKIWEERRVTDPEETLFRVRKATLDDWSKRVFSDHGGSVVADIAVIASCTNAKQAEGWMHAFEMSYGVSFEILQRERTNSNIPDPLLLVFDRRASVKHLFFWRDEEFGNTKSAKRIGECANAIIMAWRQNANDLFKDGSESLKLFNEMQELWRGAEVPVDEVTLKQGYYQILGVYHGGIN